MFVLILHSTNFQTYNNNNSSRSPLNMFTTVQRLLTAGRVTKLVDARDDRELVILRSNCGGSLSDNIDGISALLAPARETIRAGGKPSPSRWSTRRSAGCATSGLRRSRCAGTLSRTATSARTMRRARPAVRGREGASARGARAAMLACHEAPSMAGHTLVSFALELSVYACMCVYMYTCHMSCACVCMYALSIVRSFARKLSAVITPLPGAGGYGGRGVGSAPQG